MKKLIPYILILLIIAACDTKPEQGEQGDKATTTRTEKTDEKIANTKFEDVDIELLKVKPIQYIGMQADVEPNNIQFLGNTITESYGKIVKQIEAEHAPDTVKVMSIYQSFGDKIELVIAMQIGDEQSEQRKRNGVLQYGTTNGGYAVKGVHKGSYKNLLNTHDKMKRFIDREKLQMIGSPYEIYVTGPAQQQNDTTNWVTEIYYPVNDMEMN